MNIKEFIAKDKLDPIREAQNAIWRREDALILDSTCPGSQTGQHEWILADDSRHYWAEDCHKCRAKFRKGHVTS